MSDDQYTNNYGPSIDVGGTSYSQQYAPAWAMQTQVAKDSAANYRTNVGARADAPGGGGGGGGASVNTSLAAAFRALGAGPSSGGGGGGGGSSSGGAGYDPLTQMSAYQQAQLNQQNQQFYSNLANNQYQFGQSNALDQAKLGQQGSQFQQTYGLDLAQFTQSSIGSPYQWAQLGLNANQIDAAQQLDTRRVSLAEQLGQGEEARGWANLILAEEDHDLRMMLGQGDLAKSQAQIQATMAGLGIDLYKANLGAEIDRAKLALSQQQAAAQAGALSAQAAADTLRAQAALRAVEVDLELGNGNLELGYQKANDARELGLGDLAVRREELGLKDKVATQDIALRTMLGVEGINVDRERMGVDRQRIESEERRDAQRLGVERELGVSGQATDRYIAELGSATQREKTWSDAQNEKLRLIASLRGPRDIMQYAKVLRAANGNEPGFIEALRPGSNNLISPTGAPVGNAEAASLGGFLQDTGQFLPADYMGRPQFPTAPPLPSATQPGGQYGYPGQFGPPPGGFGTPPGQQPDFMAMFQQMFGQGQGQQQNQQAMFQAPSAGGQPGQPLDWQQALAQVTGQSGGSIGAGPATMNMPAEWQGWSPTATFDAADGSTYAVPSWAGTVKGHWENQGTGSEHWVPDPDTYDSAGRRIRTMVGPDGTEYSQIVKQSGGWVRDAAGNTRPDTRDVDEMGRPVEATSFGGLPVQEEYRDAQGYTYAVPHGYGPQHPGDVRTNAPQQYQVQDPATGQWVNESDLYDIMGSSGQVVTPKKDFQTVNANGTVTMANGQVQDARGNPLPAGAQTNQPGQFGPASGQQPAMGGYTGGFGTLTPDPFNGYTGATMGPGGIQMPNFQQIQMPDYAAYMAGQNNNSVVSDMMKAYYEGKLQNPSAPAPAGNSAGSVLNWFMDQYNQAQNRMQNPTPPATGTTPPATGTTPPPVTGQAPSFPQLPPITNPTQQIQAGNTTGNPNWLPAATGSAGYGAPGGPSVDFTTDYRTANANAVQDAYNKAWIQPVEAGGAPLIQYLNTKQQGYEGSWGPQANQAPAGGTYSKQTGGMTPNPAGGYQQWSGQGVTPTPVPGGNASAMYNTGQTIPQYSNPAQPTTYQNFGDMNAYGDPGRAGPGNPPPGGATQYRADDPNAYVHASYASGTTYVPQDQVAQVHQGEMIVPATQNPYNPEAQEAQRSAANASMFSGQPSPTDTNSMVSTPTPAINHPGPAQAAPTTQPEPMQAQSRLAQMGQADTTPATPTRSTTVTTQPGGAVSTTVTEPVVTPPATPVAPPPGQWQDQANLQAQWNGTGNTSSATTPRWIRAANPAQTPTVSQPAQPLQDRAYWEQRLSFLETSLQGDWDPAAQAQYRQQADAVRAKLASMPATPAATTPTPTVPGTPVGAVNNPSSGTVPTDTNPVITPVPVTPPAPVAPTSGTVYNAPAAENAPIAPEGPLREVFGRMPQPNQVPYYIWERMLPTERDLAIAAWEDGVTGVAYRPEDVEELINRNRPWETAYNSGRAQFYAPIAR